MIVLETSNKKQTLVEIQPEDYVLGKHIKPQYMSARQRECIIGKYLQISNELKDYLLSYDSILTLAVNQAMKGMISGRIPFNIAVLAVLLKDTDAEMQGEQ